MKRVVITGLGAVTPIGNSVNAFWDALVAGRSGAATITRFDAARFKTRFACELKYFNPAEHLDKQEIRKTDLFTQFALIAADQAIADSGIRLTETDPLQAGVIFGTGQGGMQTFEEQVREYVTGGSNPR